jgi:hypothetical protein
MKRAGDSSPHEAIADIDETDSQPPQAGLGYVEVSRPYDPQQQLDAVRARLAFSLVGLLTIAITGAFVLILTARTTGVGPDTVKTIIEIVITPIVTLVSAATGFYFGTNLSGRKR